MTKSESKSLIDAVDIGEVKIDFVASQLEGRAFPGMLMTSKYALMISSTGTRLGAGTRTTWSEETHVKLRELIAAMEKDICNDVFGGAPTSAGGHPENDHNLDDVPGL
jgi:hypothetical protein